MIPDLLRDPLGSVIPLRPLSHVLTAQKLQKEEERTFREVPATDRRVTFCGSELFPPSADSLWDAASPRRVCLGSEPVRALLVLDDSVWASCGNSVTVMDISSFTTQVSSLLGLWEGKFSSLPCLFSSSSFTRTFCHGMDRTERERGPDDAEQPSRVKCASNVPFASFELRY